MKNVSHVVFLYLSHKQDKICSLLKKKTPNIVIARFIYILLSLSLIKDRHASAFLS